VAAENRYNLLKKVNPEAARLLWERAQRHVLTRYRILQQQAEMVYSDANQFETGVVDASTLAAVGPREVTSPNIGPNMPAGGNLEQLGDELDAGSLLGVTVE